MQAIAAFLAVRQARTTGQWAWILLSLAFVLLAALTGHLLYQALRHEINLDPVVIGSGLGASAVLLAVLLVLLPGVRTPQSATKSPEIVRERESRFSRVMDSGMIGIAICDDQGRVREANAELIRVAGMNKQTLIRGELTWRDLVPSAHHLAIEAAVYANAPIGRCTPFEATLVRKDGHRAAVLIGAVSLDDGVALLFLDITEHKRVEQALIEREQRFRALIDNSSDAIALIDHTGKFMYASPTTKRILGYEVDACVGRILLDLVHHEERADVAAQLARLVRSPGAEVKMQTRVQHADGAYRVVDAMFKNMRSDPSVRAIVVNYHDITEHQRAEDELRTSNRMQQLLLRELNHRVRNNLAGLISLIEMSASSASDIPTLANTIRNRVHSMAAVHGMLSHTSWSAVPLEEMIRKLLPHGRRGKVELHGPQVEIPAHQCTPMGMVIGELMANSLKYGSLSTPDGRVEISWHFADLDAADFVAIELVWAEEGGPPIDHTPTPSLGTSLITGFVRSDLRGEATLEYPRAGAHHRLLIRLDQVHQPVGATE